MSTYRITGHTYDCDLRHFHCPPTCCSSRCFCRRPLGRKLPPREERQRGTAKRLGKILHQVHMALNQVQRRIDLTPLHADELPDLEEAHAHLRAATSHMERAVEICRAQVPAQGERREP